MEKFKGIVEKKEKECVKRHDIKEEKRAERFDIFMVTAEKKINLEEKKTKLEERRLSLRLLRRKPKCCPRRWAIWIPVEGRSCKPSM